VCVAGFRLVRRGRAAAAVPRRRPHARQVSAGPRLRDRVERIGAQQT